MVILLFKLLGGREVVVFERILDAEQVKYRFLFNNLKFCNLSQSLEENLEIRRDLCFVNGKINNNLKHANETHELVF